jgi:hypothetical protein
MAKELRFMQPLPTLSMPQLTKDKTLREYKQGVAFFIVKWRM